VARVLFLHEELMKLPSFPRKALEADLSLYSNGSMGKVIDNNPFQSIIHFKLIIRTAINCLVI